jgi:hypothetical protein
MPNVGGTAVTPMKRVPILANFEEWMKMATDNVIYAELWTVEFELTGTENQCDQLVEFCAH